VLYKPYCVIIVTIKVCTWLCPKRSVLNSHMKTHNGGVKQIRSHPLPRKHLPIPSRKASRIARHEKLICLALSNCLHIVECLHASRAHIYLGVPHRSSLLLRYFVSTGSRWRVCFREAKYALVLSSHHNYIHP